MSLRLGSNSKDVQQLMDYFVNDLAEQLSEDNSLGIQGFGIFEVKKKLERIVTNPNTKQKMLVPPKLTLNFKPNAILKEKVKNGNETKG